MKVASDILIGKAQLAHAAQRITSARNCHDIGAYWHRVTKQNGCSELDEAGQDLRICCTQEVFTGSLVTGPTSAA